MKEKCMQNDSILFGQCQTVRLTMQPNYILKTICKNEALFINSNRKFVIEHTIICHDGNLYYQ